MYNIAKVAKGEILVYFNHIFDALCKVCRRHDPFHYLFSLRAQLKPLTRLVSTC